MSSKPLLTGPLSSPLPLDIGCLSCADTRARVRVGRAEATQSIVVGSGVALDTLFQW